MAPTLHAPSRLADFAGRRRSVMITLSALTTHAFFAYAQLSGLYSECGIGGSCTGARGARAAADPGGLFQGLLEAHVEYDAGGILKPGLQEITKAECCGRW